MFAAGVGAAIVAPGLIMPIKPSLVPSYTTLTLDMIYAALADARMYGTGFVRVEAYRAMQARYSDIFEMQHVDQRANTRA